MRSRLLCALLLLGLPHLDGKDPELPLCPTNIQFFPQNLPMHCRMPTAADLQNIQHLPNPTLPPFPPPFYQSPLPGPGMPVPGPGMPVPGPMPMPFPGAMPLPGGIPMPMPGLPGPAHKLPVIVMPFYSPDTSFKKPQRPPVRLDPRKKYRIRKRRPRKHRHLSTTDESSETDTSSNGVTDTSEDEGWWARRHGTSGRRTNKHREKRRRHQRQELLTPVLQYVTKDGYVIFEKKISRGEATDWLQVKAEDNVEATTYSKQEIDEFVDVEKEEVKHDKEKAEVRTERNSQKHHKRKKYKMSKKVEE
ncbi:unnamed protein product [Leptosia nina]|uniref:Uncharacterized protein n=1 Tax=Leptosia nina TaxID=320188 RepID=A0AAV1J2N4_9NEOP